MSYILEALEKMERQRVKQQGTGSWVDDLIKGTGKDSSTGGNRIRLAVACSAFFCLIGISAGLMVMNRDNISKIEGNTTISPKADTAVRNIAQQKPVQNLEKKSTPESMADKEDQKESLPPKNVVLAVAKETPDPFSMDKVTNFENIPQQKSVIESDKNSSSDGLGAEKGDRKQPLPAETVQLAIVKQKSDTDKNIPQQEPMQGVEKKSLSRSRTDQEVPKPIASAKRVDRPASMPRSIRASATESSPASPEVRKPVDLTERYKLSSTGKNNGGSYATIEGTAYNIGDRFKDLIITKIEKDRVYLKQRKNGQPYVIIFRYKR